MANTTLQGNIAFHPDSIVPVSEAVPGCIALDTRIATLGPVIEGDAPSIRLPFVAVQPMAGITKKGKAITESTPGLSELVVRTVKVGLLTEVSREAYSHEQSASSITDSARRAVTRQLDTILLAKKTATDNGPGIAHTHGISNIDATGYAQALDALLDAIAAVAEQGANPTAIVMNFATWAKLLKVKGEDGRGIVSSDVANAPQASIYGIPLVINGATPADTILVLDSSTILVSLGNVYADVADGDAFRRDSLQIRITCRLGWGSINAAQIGKVTIK